MKRGWCASLLLALVMPVVMVGCGGGKRPYVPLIEQTGEVDFSLWINDPDDGGILFVPEGGHEVAGLLVQWKGSGGLPVSLSTSWQGTAPAGVSVRMSPVPATYASGGRQVTVEVRTTAGTTSPGRHVLRITGTDGVRSRSADLDVWITGFTVTLTPSSQVLDYYAWEMWTATVTPLNGFRGTVALSQTGLDPGLFAIYWQDTTLAFTGGDTPQSVYLEVRMEVWPPNEAYPFAVTGTSGAITEVSNTSTLIRGLD